MEYVQERIATLHEYDTVAPTAPVDRATVIVPLTARDYESGATERVFNILSSLAPERVIVPLRANPPVVHDVAEWLHSFDLPLTLLWCNAPQMRELLAIHSLNGEAGKGRDVWLALGCTGDSEYIVIHDADATTYDETTVPRLLFPLSNGYEFSKAYYARLEDERLYGRLFRLFVTPLIRALRAQQGRDNELLSYLSSFRYALSGEFAMSGKLAQQLRIPRGWGLEIGTLGDMFMHAGFDGTAQVDLGVHQHEHRPVEGEGGLGGMAHEVGKTLFTVLEEHGVTPDYEQLSEQYRSVGQGLVDQYTADAAFNSFAYDPDNERKQVDIYADAVTTPGIDTRLPPWNEVTLSPDAILDHSQDALAGKETQSQQ